MLAESGFVGSSCCLDDKHFELTALELHYERNMNIYETIATLISNGAHEHLYDREHICAAIQFEEFKELFDRLESDIITQDLIGFPNPSNGEISRNIPHNEIDKMLICNLNGQVVYRQDVFVSNKLNLTHLKEGMYLLSCHISSKETRQERIIILE